MSKMNKDLFALLTSTKENHAETEVLAVTKDGIRISVNKDNGLDLSNITVAPSVLGNQKDLKVGDKIQIENTATRFKFTHVPAKETTGKQNKTTTPSRMEACY